MENHILITKNRRALLPIVISSNPTEIEKFASEELSEYLEKVSGAVFEIMSEDDVDGKAIYVGYTGYAGCHD